VKIQDFGGEGGRRSFIQNGFASNIAEYCVMTTVIKTDANVQKQINVHDR
jgi:hypothetical protein